jgi:hypothetical protein
MRPKTDAAIYRPDLGQAVMEYEEGPSMAFIGPRVMPVFRTANNAGTYPVIPKEALLDAGDDDRAPRGTYNRDDWDYERGTYQTAEKGREELLDDSERELFDQEQQGMAEFISTKRAHDKIMRAAERRIAAMTFNSSNFSANSITTEWDTAASCTPITDVKDAVAAFRLQCGMLPDALILSYNGFLDAKHSDQVTSQLKYTFPGIDLANMTSVQLAQALGVSEVLVGGGVYNSAGKGLDATIASLWDDEYAALIKISNGPDITQPGFGRTFLWTEDSPSNPIVESYREETRRSDVFRVRHHIDEAFITSKNTSGTVVSNIAAACMYLMDNMHT